VVGSWQLRESILLIDRASLESRSATIVIFSILAILTVFLIDLTNGKEIWLHILYVFPIGVLAFSCVGITPVVIGVLLFVSVSRAHTIKLWPTNCRSDGEYANSSRGKYARSWIDPLSSFRFDCDGDCCNY
jgi:hypothetical protein